MKKKKTIETNVDLRGSMLDLFNELLTGEPDLREVRAKCSTAGVILKTAALQMKYADMRGEKPEIDFLED